VINESAGIGGELVKYKIKSNHTSTWLTNVIFIILVAVVVVSFFLSNRMPDVADDPTELGTKPTGILPAIGASIYWDMRSSMRGFLEVLDNNNFDNLITAIDNTRNGANIWKIGYHARDIEIIQASDLRRLENYAQASNYNRPVMANILRRMRENLGNARDDNAFQVLVTCTWFHNHEALPRWQSEHNDVIVAMHELLEFDGGRALLYVNLPWRDTNKSLFILIVGHPTRVFNFSDSMIRALENH